MPGVSTRVSYFCKVATASQRSRDLSCTTTRAKTLQGTCPQVRALRPTSAYTTSMMACCRSYKPKDQEMTDANLEPRRTMTSSSSRTWPHYASNIKTIQTVIYKQPSQQRSRNAPLVGLPPDAHCNTLWTAWLAQMPIWPSWTLTSGKGCLQCLEIFVRGASYEKIINRILLNMTFLLISMKTGAQSSVLLRRLVHKIRKSHAFDFKNVLWFMLTRGGAATGISSGIWRPSPSARTLSTSLLYRLTW